MCLSGPCGFPCETALKLRGASKFLPPFLQKKNLTYVGFGYVFNRTIFFKKKRVTLWRENPIFPFLPFPFFPFSSLSGVYKLARKSISIPSPPTSLPLLYPCFSHSLSVSLVPRFESLTSSREENYESNYDSEFFRF